MIIMFLVYESLLIGIFSNNVNQILKFALSVVIGVSLFSLAILRCIVENSQN